jgi:preprotein translocase subunit SecF
MKIIKYRSAFFIISFVLFALSIASLSINKWNYSIEFTGGALLELTYPEKPNVDEVKTAVEKLNWGSVQVQAAGEKGVIIRTKDLTEDERQSLVKTASVGKDAQIARFNSYGPSIGAEMRQKSYWAIIAVILGIVMYVAYAFRQVSKPVSSWVYGLVTIVALVHDVLIPAGIYIMMSANNIAIQIDILFVTALLTVLGFSVHDTIVVFDRTRENLRLHGNDNFATTVGKSVEQTFVRSINTSLTVLFISAALFFFGGESTKYFAFTLGIGIIFGTYSSIFIASPLLVTIANYLDKKKK